MAALNDRSGPDAPALEPAPEPAPAGGRLDAYVALIRPPQWVKNGFVAMPLLLTPEALAIYTFLCLAADRRGVSFYRRDRIARELGLDDVDTAAALQRLRDLDLVAYAPYRTGAADGFHQVLSLPAGGPRSGLPDDLVGDLVTKTRISSR